MYRDGLDDDALEPESGGGFPFPTVRLQDKGQVFIGMMVAYDPEWPLYEFGTQERKTYDGKPLTQDLLFLMLMQGSDCDVALPKQAGEDRAEIVKAEPGMVVRVYIQGHNRYTQGRGDSFRVAKEKHGRMFVGDVIAGKFTESTYEGIGGRRLTQAKKLVSFAMRRAKDEELPLVEKCRQERGPINEMLEKAKERQGRGKGSEATAPRTPAPTTPSTPAVSVDQLI